MFGPTFLRCAPRPIRCRSPASAFVAGELHEDRRWHIDADVEDGRADQDVSLAGRELIARYGLQWGAQGPQAAYHRLAECNRCLSEADRRQVLTASALNHKERTA